jgi:hypothetical protein
MEFNSSPGDLMELSPLFSDDSRVAEAASIAQKLRKMASLSYNVIFSYIFTSQHLIDIDLHKHDDVLSKLISLL